MVSFFIEKLIYILEKILDINWPNLKIFISTETQQEEVLKIGCKGASPHFIETINMHVYMGDGCVSVYIRGVSKKVEFIWRT